MLTQSFTLNEALSTARFLNVTKWQHPVPVLGQKRCRSALGGCDSAVQWLPREAPWQIRLLSKGASPASWHGGRVLQAASRTSWVCAVPGCPRPWLGATAAPGPPPPSSARPLSASSKAPCKVPSFEESALVPRMFENRWCEEGMSSDGTWAGV